MYQGNLDYLKSQRDYLLRLVKQIDERIDENGVERLDGIRFLDWPTSENRNVIHSGLQSLSFMAMKAAVQIGEYIGDRDMIRMASSCLERMKGVAVDAHDNSQAAALNIISGLSTDPEKDCETILKNGLDGFSTFYGYYMLEALAMLGKYDEAITYLKNFDADEEFISPAIIGTIGDCYVNMDKYEEGVGYFERAAKKADNDMLSPIYLKKAATVYEKLGNKKKALEMYQKIKDSYPKSMSNQDIEKYIVRDEETGK